MSLSTCNRYGKVLTLSAFTLVNCAASCLLRTTALRFTDRAEKKAKQPDRPKDLYKRSISNPGLDHIYNILFGMPEDAFNIIKNCSEVQQNYQQVLLVEPSLKDIPRIRLLVLMYFQCQQQKFVPQGTTDLHIALTPKNVDQIDKIFRVFCKYDSGLQEYAQRIINVRLRTQGKNAVNLDDSADKWVNQLVQVLLKAQSIGVLGFGDSSNQNQ